MPAAEYDCYGSCGNKKMGAKHVDSGREVMIIRIKWKQHLNVIIISRVDEEH